MYRFEKISCRTILFATALILFSSKYAFSQWIPQSVPVSKPILKIDLVNENIGWAITHNTSLTDTAHILATTDGGVTWTVQYQGNVGLRSLDAINDSLCYAGGVIAGGWSIIYKTTNGGITWTENNIGANKVADDMFFVNADTGFICDGLAPSLDITTDGGVTWQQRRNGLLIQSPRTLYFLNYNTGYCGGDNKIFKTTNGGLNWFQLNAFSNFPQSIQFLNDEYGFISFNSNTVGRTTDGGINWVYSNPNIIGSEEIPDVNFLNENTGWAGSDIGRRIYKSSDGGLNWIIQIDSAGSNSINMFDTLLGWSGGRFGISRTTNGGLTFISNTGNEIPASFKLYQNYPNPFNPVTAIRFEVSKHIEVKLKVYNTLGQSVAVLVDQKLEPGIYEYTWNASGFSTGVYFYVLETDEFRDTKKLVLLK